jgi:hypothetical protein
MSENRKPEITILLRYSGKNKSSKLEIFNASQWGGQDNQYRLRAKGKWYPEGQMVFYYKTQIRDMIHRSIKW